MPSSLAVDAIKKEPRPADMSADVCEDVLEEGDTQEAGAAADTGASTYHPDLGRVTSGPEGTMELTSEETDGAAAVKAITAAAEHAGRTHILAKITHSASFTLKDAETFSRAMSTDGQGACMYHPDLGYVGDGPPETEEEAKAFALRAGLLHTLYIIV